jgi:hypothetical protein
LIYDESSNHGDPESPVHDGLVVPARQIVVDTRDEATAQEGVTRSRAVAIAMPSGRRGDVAQRKRHRHHDEPAEVWVTLP